MKRLYASLALAGMVSVPGLAAADGSPLTGNIGVTTDYIFRGVSQSQHEPAIQGGFDYTHASGLYVGTWLSNVSWVNTGGYKTNNSLEWDLYGGYRGSLPADVGYDVGVIHYEYPGNSVAGIATPDTTEAYAGLSWKILSLKYSYVVSDYFVGWTGAANAKTRGTDYIEAAINYDLGSGWGVLAHVGHQSVKHDDINRASYTDWKLGLSKDVGFGTVGLAYTDTDANTAAYTWGGKKVADGRLALSFTKSF